MHSSSRPKQKAAVRKGSWTAEEDILLRNCIEKYGEGKWHQVPYRAGLNRCRKSCRLRWLNYLRPDIKRGYFSRDEVDLIIRLHKLLGNRWSLIAGRLPGRTANDVKNFWNTHIDKKSLATATVPATETNQHKNTITVTNIFKPRPWNFLKPQAPNSATQPSKPQTNDLNPKNDDKPYPTSKVMNPESDHCLSTQDRKAVDDECIRWWRDLLVATEDGELGTPCSLPVDTSAQIWLSELDHDQANGCVDQSCEFTQLHVDDVNVLWTLPESFDMQ